MANNNKKGQSCQTSSKLVATMKAIETVTNVGARVIIGNHETRAMYADFVSKFKDEDTACFMMAVIPKLVFLDEKIRSTFRDEFIDDSDALRAYYLALDIREALGLDEADEMIESLSDSIEN